MSAGPADSSAVTVDGTAPTASTDPSGTAAPAPASGPLQLLDRYGVLLSPDDPTTESLYS
ncbi:MAG: hypothetical protein R2761_07660 [Acidimicrobiales bacterium]